jgi:hypothetical protein
MFGRLAGAVAPWAARAAGTALLGPAGGFAAGALAGHLAGRKRQPPAAPSPAMGTTADMAAWASRMGAGARDQAAGSRSAIDGFNPMDYTRTQAGAMATELGSEFAEQEGRRMASLNSRGLYRSDLGGARAQSAFQNRMARALAGLSMQGAQMEQGRLNALSAMDRDDVARYEDMGVGLNMTDRAQRDADTASRRGMWGSLIGAGATVGGAYLGRPRG